ncbi:hypothetical protein [Streptomyces sp. H39-C1]|nr:hypothetical protein [Streptomyces sp. H39-C1]MCZ4102558.1 hypothetical protein [Streptomyces sp. H39-C1]
MTNTGPAPHRGLRRPAKMTCEQVRTWASAVASALKALYYWSRMDD